MLDERGMLKFRGFFGQYELTAAGRTYKAALNKGSEKSPVVV